MIQDKTILIHNIYYMLSYAFQILRHESYKQLSIEPFNDMHNFFATILSNGIGDQLKQGLYREYVGFHENLSVIHGKINIEATVKNAINHKRFVGCDADELSENNLFNQIIKTTVGLLLNNSDVNLKYKEELKKEMLFFSNISTMNPRCIKWSEINYSRNNQTYRMLLSICRLIIQGMLITTEPGHFKMANFIDEQRMCRLYEKFVYEYYKRHYPDLKVTAPYIQWATEDFDKSFLPEMHTDIQIQRGNNVVIIDTKYYAHITKKRYDKNLLHSNNLYQIFTYVKNRDYEFCNVNHNVSGVLLYAATDEDIQPNVKCNIHGNIISVRTLNLNLPFKEISCQLDRIISEYFPTGVHKKG